MGPHRLVAALRLVLAMALILGVLYGGAALAAARLTQPGARALGPPGLFGPSFVDAPSLLVALQATGLVCADPVPFDAAAGTDDAGDVRSTAACALAGGPVRVMVYEDLEARAADAASGRVSENQCALADGAQRLPSIVGRNWRVVAGSAADVEAVDRALGRTPARDDLSCLISG